MRYDEYGTPIAEWWHFGAAGSILALIVCLGLAIVGGVVAPVGLFLVIDAVGFIGGALIGRAVQRAEAKTARQIEERRLSQWATRTVEPGSWK